MLRTIKSTAILRHLMAHDPIEFNPQCNYLDRSLHDPRAKTRNPNKEKRNSKETYPLVGELKGGVKTMKLNPKKMRGNAF